MSSVSVIVPARDVAETIGATLDALSRQTVAPSEVIVVDDGSTDATAEIVRSHPLRAVLLNRPAGRGPGEARNAGVAQAKGEVLAFTDSDCEPADDWLASGLERMKAADLVQGRVQQARTPGPFDRTINVAADRGLFETANLFVTRRLFERLGGFDDFVEASQPKGPLARARHAGRGFGEDAVFGWRARREDAVVQFAPEVVVRHAVFPGGPLTLLSERWRLRHFPALVRRVPELRRYLLVAIFLNRRTAALDLALLAVVATLALGALPLLIGVLPYLAELVSSARRGGWRQLPLVALADVAGDLVGFVGLIWGSVSSRTLVI